MLVESVLAELVGPLACFATAPIIYERRRAMAESNNGPCKTTGTGGVGESGSASQVVHQVTGASQQLMVVKTVETSLCGDTAAIATLVVDGQPVATGNISVPGTSIQATAEPGSWAVALVQTVPLHNDIICIRLGELEYELQQCELVD